MNYRHAYHAGSFADVLKHAALALVCARLNEKEKPYRLFDTHAGAGWYDFDAAEAQRSPEWRDGAGRIWTATPPPEAAQALAPYVAALRALNPDGTLRRYPGSPALLAELARPQDALRFCELHGEDARALAVRFEPDPRVKVEARDGYAALKAWLPPPERRGLALLDPPYEDRDEAARLREALAHAWRRWPTGTYMLWRPLKDVAAAAGFDADIARLVDGPRPPRERLLRADMWVRAPLAEGKLAGAGILVVNPPFTLEASLAGLLPWLAQVLAQGEGAGWRLDSPSP